MSGQNTVETMRFIKKLSCGFWNIGIIDTPVEDILKGDIEPRIRWMQHSSKTKFYADPFPIGEDNDCYTIAAEEYSYFTGKGVIVKLFVDKKSFKLNKREPLIETKYHLSFPFPFDGGFVPEQFRSGKLYFYKDGSERCICDYPLIDPVIYRHNSDLLLFGTLPCEDNKGHNRSLFWFKYNGNKFIPISNSPIKEDVTNSRAAGSFFSYKGKLYRGAQDCSELYGGQVRIMEVDMRDDAFSEVEVASVNSDTQSKFNEGLHTFNPWNRVVIIDGFQMETRLFLKPMFVVARFLRKILRKTS